MEIRDATAFVTGANRGTGLVYVRHLLDRGAGRVYAAARDPATLAPVTALDPARVVAVRLDVTDAAQVAEAAERAADTTLLINNAGVLSFGGALDVDAAAMQRDMAVNYAGLAAMSRAFAPGMERAGGGTIANMLTLLSFVAAPGFSAYNASKAAAWSMAMSLRAYLQPRGIHVLNAFPAGIDTDMLAAVDAPKDAPDAVVRDVLDGVEAGAEDVYPASAADVHAAWRSDPKAVERSFAAMM